MHSFWAREPCAASRLAIDTSHNAWVLKAFFDQTYAEDRGGDGEGQGEDQGEGKKRGREVKRARKKDKFAEVEHRYVVRYGEYQGCNAEKATFSWCHVDSAF